MPRGPLPDPNAQRRNAATIPTTQLPAEGYQGEIPEIPSWVTLDAAGARYWSWAWRTQEAAAWGTGAVDSVARRASLEDDLAAIELASRADLTELLERGFDMDREKFIEMVESTFKVLGKLAGGRLAIIREAGKLDDVLGLTPKSKQNLRWEVSGTPAPAQQPENPVAEAPPTGTPAKQRLRVVNGDG